MSGAPTGVVADSPLARRNPTVKLALLTVVSVVALVVLDPLTPAVLYGLALVGVAVGTRAAPRTLLRAHVPFAAFAVGVLAVNAVSRAGVEVWHAGPLRVTDEGLTLGAALAARTLLVGVLAVGFVLSTDAVALMTSLHTHARLGPRVTYAVLAGVRMLQDMPREWATFQHAHAVRAPPRAAGRPVLGVRHQAGAVFGLLVVSLRRGERLAQSLESRGLGLAPRTVWRPVPLGRDDVALAVVVLGTLAVVLAASAGAGVLRGPGALG